MNILALAIALLTTFASGFGLTALLWRKHQPILVTELFGLSWIFGTAVVSVLLWILGTFLTGIALVLTVGIACMALGWLGCKQPGLLIQSGYQQAKGAKKWLCVLLLLFMLCVPLLAMPYGLVWDGLFNWEFKARCAFLSGGALPASFFSDPGRVIFHPANPLYIPLTELWIYLWMDEMNQTLVRIVSPLFYLSGIALLWSAMVRIHGQFSRASVMVLVPIFVPSMTLWPMKLYLGYSDLPLATVYFAGVSALLLWKLKAVDSGWRIAMVCGGILPWIKAEGLVLFVSLCLVAATLCGWRQWKKLLGFVIPGLLMILAWKCFLHLVQVAPEDVFEKPGIASLVNSLPRLPVVLRAILGELASYKHWSLLWLLTLGALGCLAWRRRIEALALTIALVLPLCLYALPYLLTKLDLQFHIATSLERLVSHLAMVAVLAIGLALGLHAVVSPSAREHVTKR